MRYHISETIIFGGRVLEDKFKEKFLSKSELQTEIINLSAELELPKGTETFISDVHGDFGRFSHIMRSGAGNISRKVEDLFEGRLTTLNQKKLSCLIYYPSQVIRGMKFKITNRQELDQWYMDAFNHLIEILRYATNKYPKNLVKKSIEPNYWTTIENMLLIDGKYKTKNDYSQGMLKSIVKLGMADDFIVATCHAIQRLSIERIHIVGDIYDRGAHPNLVLNYLVDHWQNFDIQWGNHDILWMGTMAGSKLCMANLIRLCARYHNLGLLRDAYDIDLTSLVTFARHFYRPLPNFEENLEIAPKIPEEERITDNCVQQAAAIMQFKLEGQAIKRRPEFHMEDRLLLDKLSQGKNLIELNGQEYEINNGCFQLINPADPYQIAHPEQVVLIDLINQFTHSSKLNEHMWFMADHGSMYLKHNGNLLFHGCVPVDEKGNFTKWEIDGHIYAGKALFDYFNEVLLDAMHHPTTGDCFNSDIIWYLWCGQDSPLFGKDKMATFESYFLQDTNLTAEKSNPFYQFCDDEAFIKKIKAEFDIPESGHIVIGHTPPTDESPLKAKGNLIMINAGRPKTENEGGYTLLYDSFDMQLIKLNPFVSMNHAINPMEDVAASRKTIERFDERKMVYDTDFGKKIQQHIDDLVAELRDNSEDDVEE